MIAQMSQREKTLAFLVGGAIAVLLNVFIIKFFMGKYNEYSEIKIKAEGELRGYKILDTERERWAKRDAWLTANLHPMGEEAEMDKSQRDYLKSLAQKNDILIDSVSPGKSTALTSYTAFNTGLECKGGWEQLIGFLSDLQNQKNFTVVDPMDIKVDVNDKTKFKASIRVVKWFAPTAGVKPLGRL